MSLRIEDYAMIGDCHTAALVSKRGSIDWLCLPAFDSDACFAALLGDANNGYWSMSPVEPIRKLTRRYRKDTLILETEFETDSGSVLLVDCMTPADGFPSVLRMVVGKRGVVRMKSELVIRFDYGSIIPWVRRRDGGIAAIAPHGEGQFLACSFWLADNYVLQGRHVEAEQLFEKLLAIRNDLGLLSEEYDPVGKRLLGNFPQAFSHVGLVNTALNLNNSSRVHRFAAAGSAAPN